MKKINTYLLTLCSATLLAQEPVNDSGSIKITSMQIKNMHTQMLVDLLNKLSGVQASDSFISIQGSTTNEVLVLMDGRPLSSSLTGTVNLAGISTTNIESIEIIKGAGASVYGNNTSGGVVLITSKKSAKNFTNRVDVAKGSLDTNRMGLSTGKWLGEYGVSLDANHESSNGHRINGDSETNNMKLSANTVFLQSIQTDLSASYTKDTGGTSGRISSPTPHARYEKEFYTLLALLKHQTFENRFYFNGSEDQNKDADRDLNTLLKTKTVGLDSKYHHESKLLGKALFGINIENNSGDGSHAKDHSETLYALYATKNFSLDPFTYTTGLRVTHDTEFGNSVNPEISLTYKKQYLGSTLTFNHSSKTPTFKQRFYESSTLVGNPDLDMESALNFQLANTFHWTTYLSTDLNFFYSSIENGISGSYNDAGVYSYENVASSTRKGTEFTLDYKITEMISFNVSYLFLLFKNDDTGLYLPSKPKHKVQSQLYITHDKTKMSLSTQYYSDSFNNSANTQILKEHFVADLNVNYNFSKKLKLYLEIENILNNKYDAHLGYPVAGRTFLVGINYLF